MFKIISNKKDFIQNPVLEMNEEELNNAKTDTITLFGTNYKMYADEWKHHVHVKCTDFCDADCSFCIEKSERNNPQNKKRVMESTKEVLSQLAMQGQLRTVSITGGEPTIFPYIKELINYINSYKLTLFSINTNGRHLNRIPENFNGWVDISKHAIDDMDVFKREFSLSPYDVDAFKKTHPYAKVRFQCVLGVTDKVKNIGDIVNFILHYKDHVDDFSFRNLIIDNDESKVNDLIFHLRDMLFEHGEFVEQCIQDYYVYETYKMFGTTITISWSNMKKLREYNETHDNNFLEEIIVHPDGAISGSWNKKSLIIYKYENKDGNTFIPCRGEGCVKPCKRYIGSRQKSLQTALANLAIYQCGSASNCGSTSNCITESVSSCHTESVSSCGSTSSC